MIRRPGSVAMLLCLATSWCVFLAEAGVTTLSGIRYNNQERSSRLTMQFAGEVRYSVQCEGNRLLLGFSSARPASPPGVARLQFKDGYIRSVTTDRIGQDSLFVVVVLREGTTYTLVRPADGNALFVDVVPDPEYRAPAVTAPKAPKPAPQKQVPANSSLVDIPSIARTQVEAPLQQAVLNAPAASTPAAAAVPATESGRTSLIGPDVMLLGGGGLIALLTTAGILLLIRRWDHRRAHTARSPHTAALPAADDSATREDIRALLERASRRSPVVEEDSAPQMFEERTEMAKAFGRGTEEMSLAMTLGTKGKPRANKQRLDQLVLKKASSAQRRTAARKLGVGVGEVELALQLRRFQSTRKQKEGGE